MGKRICYPAGHNADVVALVRPHGNSIGQIARDLKVGEQMLRNWAEQYGNSSSPSELSTTGRDELRH